MLRILITGANRGLGLEFTRQYLARGERVFAGCRAPEKAEALRDLARQYGDALTLLQLDVTDVASIAAAAAQVASHTGALDLLLNNAGFYPHGERPSNLDAETMMRTYRINCVGPVMVAQHCLALLRNGMRPTIVNLSSQLGSLARKKSGGAYSYGSSKAALNMLTRALSFDLRPDGIIAVAVHPGWVQTDMGGAAAPLTPPESIRGLVRVIDGLTLAESGGFFNYDGTTLPW